MNIEKHFDESNSNSEKLLLRTENVSLKEIIKNLKCEISFLREEITNKNSVIDSLTTNPLMRDGIENLTIKQDLDKTPVISNIIVTPIKNSDLFINENVPDSQNNNNNSSIKFSLERQLKEIRMIKHAIFKSQIEPPKSKVVNDRSNVTENNDTSTDTFIVGDSMINGIKAYNFGQKSKVKIKPYGGSTSRDFIHHVKPTIRKKPSKMIIHIGTNDLTNKIDTIPNMEKIVTLIQKESPKTEIALSNIIIRTDKKNMAKKINDLNKAIKDFCGKKNIDLIDNSNIDISNLSKRKLHLSQNGLNLLTKNFKSYLA